MDRFAQKKEKRGLLANQSWPGSFGFIRQKGREKGRSAAAIKPEILNVQYLSFSNPVACLDKNLENQNSNFYFLLSSSTSTLVLASCWLFKIGGSLRSILSIFTEKCSCCVLRIIEADLSRPKKATSHWALFHLQHLTSMFHPKWLSASPPPRLISADQYWILTKSRRWGHSDHPSERHCGLRLA